MVPRAALQTESSRAFGTSKGSVTAGTLGNGSAWSSTWASAALGPAAEAQRPQASNHALRRGKGEKRNPNSCRTGSEKTGKIFCSSSERS